MKNERTSDPKSSTKPNGWECFHVYGADMYNQRLTGKVAMTVSCSATDPHHVPCVVRFKKI